MTVHVDRYASLMTGMGALAAELPGPMKGFMELHGAVKTDAALSVKEKELIALGIAVTVRCAGCITCHVKDALDAGATREEIVETVGVAILMGGGPSVVYGTEALEALDEFTSVSTPLAAAAQ